MSQSNRKLYQQVADRIVAAITSGTYALGKRLPSERDLAEEFKVSRPTVREALIALEIRGLVESRHGSGVYVAESWPSGSNDTELDVGPFELTEARRLFEGESAALAATTITDEELDHLEQLLVEMADHRDSSAGEDADGAFHVAIAEATRNSAIASVIESLWEARYKSPLCVNIFARGRQGGVQQPVDDHRLILDALRAHDPKAAREAMHAHLDNVVHQVLNATEMEAIQRARSEVEAKREEVRRRASLYRAQRAKAATEGA
jgi:GntR family transcriptional repressor for pyruvate dehydrogenase complex